MSLGVISIFAMPQELEDLALTLHTLKRNSVHLEPDMKFRVDVTMCVSAALTDWNNTKIPQEYFTRRSEELCNKYLGDWAEWTLHNEINNDQLATLGCVDRRRESWKKNLDADYFIWLDCDFLFKDSTLYCMASAYQSLADAGKHFFVVTPQFVRQWDATWDVLVNNDFLRKPLDYELIADVYKDIFPHGGDINIKPVPSFKFAGGWFTLLSKELLNKTTIPDSLEHYGMEDNYVMTCCDIMKSHGEDVSQYILENLIIGESYIHRPNETIKQFVASIDRKREYLTVAQTNFNKECRAFYDRHYNSSNGVQSP